MSDDGSVVSSRDQAEFEAAAATLASVSDALEVVRGMKKRLHKREGRGTGKPAIDNGRRTPGKGRGGKPVETIAQREAKS